MESYALLFAAMLNAGTVLALAALGLLINEKSGIVNLGAEGIMLCSAIAGFAAVVHSGNDWIGFAAGMGAGALMAAAFGVLVIWLNTNQYATGLALSLFGAGFSAFAGIKYVQEKLPERPHFSIPVLGDMPLVTGRVIERLVAAHDPVEGRGIVVPVHEGKRGNPILWDRRYFADILALSGDEGARSLLKRHMEQVAEVEVGEDSVLRDFDTVESLAGLPPRLRPALT